MRLKSVVWSVYILELVETILITSTLFQQFVYGFLDITSLDRISGNWFAVPILGGIGMLALAFIDSYLGKNLLSHRTLAVTFIVQIFYAHRIAVLGKFLGKRIVSIIVFFVVMVRLLILNSSTSMLTTCLRYLFYNWELGLPSGSSFFRRFSTARSRYISFRHLRE